MTTSLPSAPTFRLVTSICSIWRASSVPLVMSMSSRPSLSDSLPVTAAPPEIDRRSAPSPKVTSPMTAPLRMSMKSAPEPRRTSPRITGSLVSGTPSLSMSGRVLSGTTTASWVKVTPVVFLLRSTAIASPVTSTPVVGVMPTAMTPVLRKSVRVPDSSRTPIASDFDPPTPAAIWPEFSNEGRDAPAAMLTPVTVCSPLEAAVAWMRPVLTMFGVEAPAPISTAVLLASLATEAIVPLL
ncbi:hypothetical protein D3C72_1411580 [compost metagenome]